MREPTSDLTLYAGIWCKRWTMPDAGVIVPQHAHDWPHITYLISGAVRVCGWTVDEIYRAPCAIKIPARTEHAFLALEPTVLLCLHAMEHADKLEKE